MYLPPETRSPIQKTLFEFLEELRSSVTLRVDLHTTHHQSKDDASRKIFTDKVKIAIARLIDQIAPDAADRIKQAAEALRGGQSLEYTSKDLVKVERIEQADEKDLKAKLVRLHITISVFSDGCPDFLLLFLSRPRPHRARELTLCSCGVLTRVWAQWQARWCGSLALKRTANSGSSSTSSAQSRLPRPSRRGGQGHCGSQCSSSTPMPSLSRSTWSCSIASTSGSRSWAEKARDRWPSWRASTGAGRRARQVTRSCKRSEAPSKLPCTSFAGCSNSPGTNKRSRSKGRRT
mmetsp:Transcript_27585/g.65407  ORF Transcript_27585/g.65407 Transcript_27585/m.65407 type:complete len:291 (-) Transcript_27585:2519-3391(-)